MSCVISFQVYFDHYFIAGQLLQVDAKLWMLFSIEEIREIRSKEYISVILYILATSRFVFELMDNYFRSICNTSLLI